MRLIGDRLKEWPTLGIHSAILAALGMMLAVAGCAGSVGPEPDSNSPAAQASAPESGSRDNSISSDLGPSAHPGPNQQCDISTDGLTEDVLDGMVYSDCITTLEAAQVAGSDLWFLYLNKYPPDSIALDSSPAEEGNFQGAWIITITSIEDGAILAQYKLTASGDDFVFRSM